MGRKEDQARSSRGRRPRAWEGHTAHSDGGPTEEPLLRASPFSTFRSQGHHSTSIFLKAFFFLFVLKKIQL